MGLYHRDVEAHAFAIVDPLQVERAEWEGFPATSLAPVALTAKADKLPWLLGLGQLSDADQATLLERSEVWDRDYDAPFFSALLQTEASAERIRMHLSRLLVQSAPDGTKTLLRWYDPLIFRHTSWLLDERQLRTLLGPIDAWTWRDNAGQWRTTHAAREPHGDNSMRLRPEQWTVIGRSGVLNRTLTHLRRTLPDFVDDAASSQQVYHLLRFAYDEQGLTSEADACLYVEQGIRHGEAFHRHPAVIACLEAARAGESTYAGACLDLDAAALHTSNIAYATSRKEAHP